MGDPTTPPGRTGRQMRNENRRYTQTELEDIVNDRLREQADHLALGSLKAELANIRKEIADSNHLKREFGKQIQDTNDLLREHIKQRAHQGTQEELEEIRHQMASGAAAFGLDHFTPEMKAAIGPMAESWVFSSLRKADEANARALVWKRIALLTPPICGIAGAIAAVLTHR